MPTRCQECYDTGIIHGHTNKLLSKLKAQTLLRIVVREVVHNVGITELEVEEGHGRALKQGARMPGAHMQLHKVPCRDPVVTHVPQCQQL